jgi:chemotaxis protein CheZ
MPDDAQFAARLRQLRLRHPHSNPELVAELVQAMQAHVRDAGVQQTILMAEIEQLAATVASARAEIAAIGADDIMASHIPTATDELDAIVAHTAAATDIILECCEGLDALIPHLGGESAQTVQNSVTRIYEACSFQDITGQRITKVVAALKAIEAKIVHIVGISAQGLLSQPTAKAPAACSADASLLNGPQLPAAAMDQSDIDALLASFD